MTLCFGRVRCFGWRQLADSGDDIAGTLLRNLPTAEFSALADRLSLVPNARHRLGGGVRHDDTNRCQPATQTARQRRSQMHRGTTSCT